jgi:signal transduction histidine kinase
VKLPRFLRWSAYGLRTKGLIVVGLPLLPLAGFWLVILVAMLRQERPLNTETRSLTIQASLARVFSNLLDADAGARNYLLTESGTAYRRYIAAVERLPADISSLENAVIDPQLRLSLESLQAIVDDELAVLARMTGTPPHGFPVIGESAALNRSAANLEHIRSLSMTMQKRQAALVSAQNLQRYRTRMLYFISFLAGSVVCAGAGIVGALVLARGVSRRASALASNADRLAHGLPPEPLPVGEDEIGLVDARLRAAARLLRRRDVELRERTAQLEGANRELEAFSYSVSHDLRAPLRAIDGFSEALELDCGAELSDQARDSLRRVRAAAGRMSTLIDELLNLSRLTRIDVRREPVDLAESASGIVADLVRRCPHRRVEVQVSQGLIADADPELVQIALHNLLDNAWKYTSKTNGARIEIGASPNGAVRVFHVRDNGAGFDMAHATRLFGAFQRLHNERDFEGTGIGLAIVQRIIARHGGRIWAEGAVNAGATFYFTLEPETGQPS